jgi:LmbE family N-acetylglucosaminyl deacetylase
MALRDAGHTILNVACSLGRQVDHDRRRAELTEACMRAGFELLIPDDLPELESGSDPAAAHGELTTLVASVLAIRSCVYVVSPSPHDGHPAHEVVGRAVRDALVRMPAPPIWGMWGLWSDLPLPNVYIAFDEARLAEIREALAAHAGEIDRNDYAALLETRASMNAVLGLERVFGFGAAGDGTRYAELLTEVLYDGNRWVRTPPARFPQLGVVSGSEAIDEWLYRRSDRELLVSGR